MVQIGSYHNLSADTLRRIKPYAKKLAGREITPECPVTPLTEEQILLRKIGRKVFSEIATFAPGTNVVKMTLTTNATNSTPTSPSAPMTQSEIDSIRQSMAESHARSMSMLSSIFRQLEILGTATDAVET